MKKENQRVMLTKRLLKDSLIAILKKENIHKVSIRELCENAGINRTTFYNHYGSQYDVLAEMENELLDHVQKNISKPIQKENEEGVKRLAELLEYLEDNVEMSRLLINNNVDEDFPQKLLYLPQIQSLVNQHFVGQYKKEQIPFVSDFVIYGSYNLVKRWINSNERIPAEELSELLLNLIDKLV